MSDRFPDDENGQVLRYMAEQGDDLSKPRDIDFTVVMPDEDAAMTFSARFANAAYRVKVNESCALPELPWDIVVVKHMLPTHAGIMDFESELDAIAAPLGGRNDGWGCFQQLENDEP